MLPESLVYPTLRLARESSITVSPSAADFVRCNARAFYRNRYFDDLTVIDANAVQYRVTHAEPPDAHDGIGKVVARLLNRPFTVRVTLEATGVNTLDAAKKAVNEWLGREPDFWEASRPLEEWREAVNRAESVRQIAALFR